jgi:hypothetical protein
MSFCLPSIQSSVIAIPRARSIWLATSLLRPNKKEEEKSAKETTGMFPILTHIPYQS